MPSRWPELEYEAWSATLDTIHAHSQVLGKLANRLAPYDEFLPSGQVILNTGTWLKRLHRVPVRFGLLPAVYYPSYRLNYFCIEEVNNDLVIGYVEIPKTPESELTWLQRLVTLGRLPKQQEAISARTVVDF